MIRKDIRDRTGRLIGQTLEHNGIKELRDRSGKIIGTYNSKTNQTHARSGKVIGTGDSLTSLLDINN